MVQVLWKTEWKLFKKLKIELPYDPAIPLMGIYPKQLKVESQGDIRTPMFIAALLTIAKKQPKCSLTDQCKNKMWYIHTVEYYLTLKRKETLTHGIICMKLDNIMLSEICQSQKKQILYEFTYMRYLVVKFIEIEGRMVVTRG